MSESSNNAPRPNRLAIALPFLLFVALAGFFGWRLEKGGDPSIIPSALIGHPAPAFDLPAIEAIKVPGLADGDLRKGNVTIVNFFASWCAPCRLEHPTLKSIAEDRALAAMGVKLVGINYKDDPANAAKFLSAEGNPYAAVGADASGRTGIDFGLTGVPETFVIRGDGVVAFKFIGPLTPETFASTLLPQIEKALR